MTHANLDTLFAGLGLGCVDLVLVPELSDLDVEYKLYESLSGQLFSPGRLRISLSSEAFSLSTLT